MALVAVGGAWTAVARAVAVGIAVAVQGYPRPKVAFNVCVVVLEVCAAVGVLRLLPPGDISEPATWLAYLLAVLVGSSLGAALIAAAITATQGYPGRTLWTSLFVPVLLVGPVSVLVGLAVLLLVSVTPWAWLLITPLLVALALLYRRFGAVTREGHSVERVYDFARRVEQVPPDEAGTRQIVAGRPRTAQRRARRPVAAALPRRGAAPRRRRRERRGLVRRPRATPTTSSAAGRWPGPTGRSSSRWPAPTTRRPPPWPGAASPTCSAPPSCTAAGEPGYLEVCDRRSDIVSFADSDRAALDSMLTHVNAAIRQQQLLTQIRYDADHDRLTGLPNRQRLAAEIDALLAADPVGARAGLILAALGNFTEVTDTLGHAASDELLLVTAGLLREHAPPQALLARMEGEQFAVLLPGLSLAGHRARRAAAARGGVDPRPGRRPGPGGHAHHRRRRRAGARHRRRHAHAARRRRAAGRRRLRRRRELPPGAGPAEPPPAAAGHRARARRWPTGRSASSSSRSSTRRPPTSSRSRRWSAGRTRATGRSRPTTSSTSPSRSAGSAPLTDHVLDLALARCRRWLDQDIALSVAVNLSAHCLTEPDLVARVRRALQRHGVPGELLTLELTEGSVIDDSVRDSTVLADLHALGLRLSMDDFGTGYSSLSQLRQLPIDEVKIDKSFVLGMSTSQGESFIARSIIELAHNLGLRVVAEGVEDELTRKLLAEMGCDKLQGFLVSRPLPDDRLESWLLARTGVRSAAPGATHRRLFVRT